MNKTTTKFKTYLNLFFCLCISITIISCNTNNEKSSNTTNVNNNEKALEKANDTIELVYLTEQWNNLLVRQDLDKLKELYAEQVSFYGSSFSNEQVISNKHNFLEKYSDFNQSITGEIIIDKIKENLYEITFPKETNYNKKTYKVQGLLIFEKISGKWKIINESDSQTDNNLNNKSNKNKKEFSTCLEVVEEIITTSPLFYKLTDGLYEAIVKNGGEAYGFMFVGSPNKNDNVSEYSETYDLKLYESYSDRIVTIAIFSFDPKKKRLYENFKTIDFNKDLILEMDRLCN